MLYTYIHTHLQLQNTPWPPPVATLTELCGGFPVSCRCKGELIFTLNAGRRASVLCMALSEDDHRLVIGTERGIVMLVDIVSGEVLHSQPGHKTAPVTALAIAQDEEDHR